MPGKHSINVDLAKVCETASARKLLTTLTWGDFVEVTGEPADAKTPVRAFRCGFSESRQKVRGLGHEVFSTAEEEFKGHSASHTINGHSVVLRLTYGGFSFLLTGDLNDQSERILTRAHSEGITRAHSEGKVDLTAEVLKAPHHGSADLSPAFVKAVSPIISVVSSGDESEQKEYIHPRATLVGALGRYSRVPEPLVFCTELVAFFKRIGWSFKGSNQRSGTEEGKEEIVAKSRYYGFQRTAYGMIKIRTDGERLLVSTNSGKDDMKEAYAYQRDENGEPVASRVRAI